MKEIFEKALEEIRAITDNEKAKNNFQELCEKKWVEQFESGDTPLYSEFEDFDITKMIQKFVAFGNRIKGYSEPYIWQHFARKSADAGYPFLCATSLLLADALFTKLTAIENFYEIPEEGVKPCTEFLGKLLNDPKAVLGVCPELDQLKPFLPKLKQQDISDPLKKIFSALDDAIVVAEPKPEKSEKPEETAPQESQSIPIPGMAAAQPGAAAPKADFENHPFFRVFVLPPTLVTLCNVVYQDIEKGKPVQEQQIFRFLQETQGMPSMRNRFITNLIILYWLVNKGKEEQSNFILRSLWDMVFQMAARDKKEINLDAPQDIMVAIWEPGMYIALVKLTIQAFEKFGAKFGFPCANGKKFDVSMLEKLKSHSFMLGYFI